MRLLNCVGLLFFVMVGSLNAAVISVGSLNNPNVAIDFDNFPTGSLTAGDINTAHPTAGITSISLNCLGRTGSYGNFISGGRGIACDSGGGGIQNYNVGDDFFDMNSITVEFDHFVTELGFQHGDRSGGGSLLSFFNGAVLVETFSPGAFQDNLFLLRSDTSFNSFTFTENRNWLVTELIIQTQTQTQSIPEPATLALLGLGFGFGLAGLGFSRRKVNA